MRQRQRRDSAREWIRTGVKITIVGYAKRYGVDRYTAYQDLTALGVVMPDSAQQWAQRPPAPPTGTAKRNADLDADYLDDPSWIILDGRMFFVAGYTSGSAPYGMFADEMAPFEE